MAKVIIYTNENGNVSVCNPHPDQDIAQVLAKDAPEHAIIVDDSELPTEHDEFFDAWELVGGKVSVNHSKATELTKARLRREREKHLAAQDVAFQRALEEGTDTTAIVAEKKRLRDLTTLADKAKTLDELKAITVEVK